jgi:CheY-like chemotaxis protein
LTGWGTQQDRQRSREAGFDQHLTKPVDLLALEAVLAGRQPAFAEALATPAPA